MKIKSNILYKNALSNSPILEPLLVLKQKVKMKIFEAQINTDIRTYITLYQVANWFFVRELKSNLNTKVTVETLDNPIYADQFKSCHYSST